LSKITSSFDLAGITAAKTAGFLNNPHVISLSIADTLANILTSANVTAWQANLTKINAITLTNTGTPNLALTAAQFSSDTGVLAKISGTYTLTLSSGSLLAGQFATALSYHVTGLINIADLSTNIYNNLTTLENNLSQLGVITLTDTSKPTFNLTAAQYSADAGALAKISGTTPYSVTVSGVAAANVAAVLNNSHVSSISVADAAADITLAANMGTLLTDISKISSITLTDTATPTLNLTVAQLSTDASVLNAIVSSYHLAVSGVAAANVAALLTANNHIISVAISDTAADVYNNLSALQTDVSKIGSIVFSDTTTPSLTLTEAQFKTDAAVLNLISSNYQLTITGVAAADVATLLGSNSHITRLTLADSAANVTAYLATLQADVGKITSITLTDTSEPTIYLTPAQASADSAILGKISSPYQLLETVTVNVANVDATLTANPTQPLTVSDSSQDVLNNLSLLENHAGQIAAIDFTDSTTPTITLTQAEYNANIDALAEIGSPYNLVINSDSSLAPESLPAFTMRAPLGTTGSVTLTLYASINGATAIELGTVKSTGVTPVEFSPNNLNVQPGDAVNLTVMTSNASGTALGAGQIEMSPGFFGEQVSGSYSASLNFKVLSLSATGAVTGLPASYSAADPDYYILKGATLSELTTADQTNPVFHQYIEAGRLAVNNVSGDISPDGNDLTVPSVIVNSNTVIANMGGSGSDGNAGILIDIPSLTGNQTVEMWVTDQYGNTQSVQTQTLTAAQPSAGFVGPGSLQDGNYQLYFTDASGENGQPGQPVPNLSFAVSPPAGGVTSAWVSAPSSLQGAVTLVVGTVQTVESYATQNPSQTGQTVYLIRDSIENIQSANNLFNIVPESQLIGAYETDGVNSNYNADNAPIQITGTQDYVRVLNDNNSTGIQQQQYSVFAVNAVDANGITLPADSSATVQFYDNGQALGSPQQLSTDGSTTLAAPLSATLAETSATVTHNLTATLNGVPVDIGIVPPGGGLPDSYVASLNVWVGTASQLPTTLSAIIPGTLYIIQDSAQNLVLFGAAIIETGVSAELSASGNLAFEVIGGQLTYLQQQEIDQNNNGVGIVNATPVSIVDTLYGLGHISQLIAGESFVVNDDVAHFTPMIDGFQNNNLSSAVSTAWNGVILTDNLANLVDSNNLNVLQSAGLPASLVVSDTVADYLGQWRTDQTTLETLATEFNTSLKVNVADSIANLQAAQSVADSQFLQSNAAQVTIVDTAANLEAAYVNGSLSSLINGINTLTGHAPTITVEDSMANLTTLLNNANDIGLIAQIQNVTVLDNAQNILNALNNGNNGNGINPLAISDNVVIADSYANVLSASQTDPSLLAQISKLNLTSGPSAGSAPLEINLNNTGGGNNFNITSGLPEVVLSYMTGPLTATEAADNNGGTLVTISEQNNPGVSVQIDLLGVTDPFIDTTTGTGQYTQGGWYHTASPGDYVTPVPVITSSNYDAATGILTLDGSNLTASSGDYQVTDLTLKGDEGKTATLTSGSAITGAPNGSSVAIQLSAADQLAVDALLNKNGVQANDGVTTYNLAASAGWDTGAAAIATQAVSVTGVTAPTLTGVGYNATTGVFTFTGSNLTDGIIATDFKLTSGTSTFQIGGNDTFSNLSVGGFTVTLSSADQTKVNSIVNAAGGQLTMAATAGWDGDSTLATGNQSVLALSGNVSTTSVNLLANLSTLESNSGQINTITLTDSTTTNVPTISLTQAQFDANINALAEIISPYNLLINNANAIAPEKIPPFSIRAPAGTSATEQVTLTVKVVVSGADAATQTFTFTTNGDTPVQFSPQSVNPQAGDVWSISVTASNTSTGASLGAGQVEVTPGFFGETVNSAYGSSLTVKFLSISSTGAITGLPGSYSAADKSYYILEGNSDQAVNLSALVSADTGSSVLHKYIQAGRLAIMGLDGAVQADGSNLTSPSVVVNGDTIPNLGNPVDGGSDSIMVTAPATDLTSSGITLQMWATTDAGANSGAAIGVGSTPFLLASQYLSTSQPYTGFDAGNLSSYDGSMLSSGVYSLFFTDASKGYDAVGNPITGLQVGVSTPNGGAVSLSTVAAISPITLVVGTVQMVENYAASNPTGTTWYLIEDTVSNIQSAGSELQRLAAGQLTGQQLLGANIDGGIAPAGNGYDSIEWPSAIQLGGTQNYVRVFGTFDGNWQNHSILAVQTTDSGVSHTIQLYDNGAALGSPQALISDGSATLGITLPTGVTLANGDHLTATMDGSAVNLGVVPPGGGMPADFSSGLTVWTGTVSQLPTSLSAINSNTLYILQDTAQNLAQFTTSVFETGVAMDLAASGNLVYDVTGGQLTSYQQQLIENGNISLLNLTPVTVNDTLLGMENVPVLGSNDSLIVHDDVAHLLYDTQAVEQNYPLSGYNYSYNPLSQALSNGQVVLTDTLADLVASGTQIATGLANQGISSVSGVVVADSLADYSSQLSADVSTIQTLATSLGVSLTYEIKDSVANLLANGSSALNTFLKANDASASTAVVFVLDSVANLEAAYSNNSLSTLTTDVKGITGHGINIVVKDSIANLSALLDSSSETGLYSELHDVTVIDTAQNIANDLNNGSNSNSVDPLSIANTIIIQDSYAHILSAEQVDQSMLSQVSKIIITAGPAAGNAALQIDLGSSYNSNSNVASALPEVVLSYMTGALTASEASDGAGGTMVTISEQSHPAIAVQIDLVGVTDSTGTAYTQGGWYHT